MKKEDLFEAVGNIDEKYVTEAGEKNAKEAVSWKKWTGVALAAAAVVLLLGAGAYLVGQNLVTRPKAPIEKHVAIQNDSSDEIAIAHRWEEMMDVQRFTALSFEGRSYHTMLIFVHPENEGEALGMGLLTGQDQYTDEIHSIEGAVRKIAGIATEAAVAVYFPGEPDRGYAYTNPEYVPNTLGEFIETLNLQNTLKTGPVYVEQGAGASDVVYEDISSEYIWSMLFSDATLVNEPDHARGKRVLGISASVDLLGYHNRTITLTEDGYLMTNLLDTGKYFHIGQDKVDAFLKEVTENHQGYIYIYDLSDGLTGLTEE